MSKCSLIYGFIYGFISWFQKKREKRNNKTSLRRFWTPLTAIWEGGFTRGRNSSFWFFSCKLTRRRVKKSRMAFRLFSVSPQGNRWEKSRIWHLTGRGTKMKRKKRAKSNKPMPVSGVWLGTKRIEVSEIIFSIFGPKSGRMPYQTGEDSQYYFVFENTKWTRENQ